MYIHNSHPYFIEYSFSKFFIKKTKTMYIIKYLFIIFLNIINNKSNTYNNKSNTFPSKQKIFLVITLFKCIQDIAPCVNQERKYIESKYFLS